MGYVWTKIQHVFNNQQDEGELYHPFTNLFQSGIPTELSAKQKFYEQVFHMLIQIADIEITYDPILTGKEVPEFLKLREEVFKNPKESIPALTALKDQRPDFPEIANVLTFAHIQCREFLKAEKLIQETYERNPDYLFAKINYADQLLRKGKKKQVAAVFNEQFDLKSLYPDRKVFHYSEARGFFVVMSFYHLAMKQKAKAEEYYHLAMKVDPCHLSVIALEKKLFSSRWKWFKILS